MSSIFEIAAMEKIAMERDHGPSNPYLNMGGGMAAKQTAGSVEMKPQPYPGYINMGSKEAPQQMAGGLGVHGSPDTGELGTGQGGDMSMCKNAFDLGVQNAVLFHEEIEKLALSTETIGRALGKRMQQAGVKGKGLGKFAPSNIRKMQAFGASKKGGMYGRALARKGKKAREAVGGGKSGAIAEMLVGNKAGKAARSVM